MPDPEPPAEESAAQRDVQPADRSGDGAGTGPGGPPDALPDGRALVTADGGPKASGLTDVGGPSGFGSVTASGRLLAGRAAGGLLGSEVGGGRVWERSPLMFVGAPSSTMNGKDTVDLAVMGLDGRLYVTSSADDPHAHLAPWLPVGPGNGPPSP